MKILFSVIVFVTAFSFRGIADDSLEKEASKTRTQLIKTENDPRPPKLRHVVAIKFKAGTDEAEIKKVENAFRDLKNKIPGIVSLEWGTNVSPEKHAKGFTHCFILGFKSEKDRNAYLIHPEHKNFGKLLGPVMDDVFVIDFWTKE